MREIKVISAEPLSIMEYWKELVHFRSLIWVFALQEIKALYAQTFLGILWALIRPLFTLFIFTVIFKLFLHVSTQSPYYLFAFSGMIAWNLFSFIAMNASTVIVQKQYVIRKMYFPKIILLLSKSIVGCVDAGISLLVLFLLMAYERIGFSTTLLFLPLFILLNIAAGFAIAIWVNAASLRFRDLHQLLPTVIGIGVWVTPVFFPTTIIPSGYELFLYINPLAGIIKGYRFALLGEPFPEIYFCYSLATMLILMFIGVYYFRIAEDKMVDYA